MTLIMRLLGPVQISQDDRLLQIPGHKPLALLAYLVMTGKAHTRQHLVDLLIDRADDPRASLRYTLSELRQAIGVDYIRANRQQIAFNFETDYWLDVTAFEQGQLDLYRGDFLEGLHVRDAFGFEDWAFFERERLRGVYQDALIQQLAEAESEGHDRMAVETAHTLLRLDNLREDWHRALMRTYTRLGQREAALAQYNVCRQVLAAELGIEPSAETTRLCERIRTGQVSQDKSIASSPAHAITQPQIIHNLPPQPTPFIGRTEELAQIAQRLADPACRLLTLTGPGGIGKTRLALQAVLNLIEDPSGPTMFSAGVYFVDLAPVASPDSLVSTIADAINFSIYSDVNLRQQFLEYLREKEILLVLDNFEHLLVSSEEAIGLVTDILAVAPTVKIIVTSREALNLREEWLFAIDGMTFPTDDTISSLEEYSAIQLFEQCARRVKPGFSLAAEQGWVVQICRMVEGMPLGIELAAAWLKMFTCKKIAQKLEQGLDLLSTSLKNMPARHRSMRAVFEHSWQLLSEAERRVLRQSSVFRGGFRREAAEQVVGATFADLVTLVDKSLLRRTPAGRYQLHELLRQFAAEKLEADPQKKEAVQNRHSEYYLAFLQQREEALKGKNQQAILAEIDAEIDNVRQGWQWVVDQGMVTEIQQVLSSLWDFYEIRAWFHEGEDVFGRAVTILRDILDKRPEEEILLIFGKAVACHSWFLYRLGLHTRGRTLAEESLSVLRQLEAEGQLGARGEMVIPLNVLGTIARIQGEYGEAKQLLQKALTICKETNNHWEIAHTCAMLSVVALELGAYREAKRLSQEALIIGKEIGNRRRIGYSLMQLGVVALRLDDYEEARQLLGKGLAIHRKLGERFGVAWSCGRLGIVAYHLNEYSKARQLCQESLTIFKETGNKLGTMEVLNGLGNISLALGESEEAKGYFLEALRMATETQTPAAALDALLGMVMLLMEKGEQEQAVELLALPLHHPASWQIFKDRARRLQAKLEMELPPEVVSAALERGKARDLETTVAELVAEFEANQPT